MSSDGRGHHSARAGTTQRPRTKRRTLGDLLHRRRPDEKVDRLMASWLGPDHRAASRLAATADIADVPAGTVLSPGAFTYVGLEDTLIAGPGTEPFTLATDAVVLVIAISDFRDIADTIPNLADVCVRPSTAAASSGPDDIEVVGAWTEQEPTTATHVIAAIDDERVPTLVT